MAYRCVATSVAGFVQQLAVAYVANGYWFYVTGWIPPGKSPEDVDRKLIDRYGIDVSKWTRCRRKKAGLANVQYLRHDRFFVLLATHGAHPFFAAEGKLVRDIRRQPLHFMGYSVSCRKGRNGLTWHPSVRIERECFRELKSHLTAKAVRCSTDELTSELRSLPFEPYAPVRDQLRTLRRAVNRSRQAAGLEPVPAEVMRRRRRPVKPFDPP